MIKSKPKKLSGLAASTENNVTEVKIGSITFQTNTSNSINKKVGGQATIKTLEKALKEGVFSSLKLNESEDK